MTKRIFRSICAVALCVFFASLVLIMGVLYDYFATTQKKQLESQTALAASAVQRDGMDYLNGLSVDQYRITWVAADGTVLFDNKADAAKMENHLEREEIKQAMSEGMGESSRYSTTLTERQLYCAKRLSDGTVLRLSLSHLTWWALTVSILQPILVVFAIAVVLSLVLASQLSKRIVKPLNELNLDSPKPESTYEELTPLITQIKTQQNQLKRQKAELNKKKEEFETATRHMSEGIILLNEYGTVLSINESASRLLSISRYCVGKDLLLFNNSLEIQELLRCAESGKHSEKIISIGESDYQFNASPVLTDGTVTGITLIIFDITEKKKAEEERREFTANVSHELKTPLQNISGCAELLSGGMVKPEDVPRFSGQIYTEAKRMITLVEDIIKLSHLDEGAADMQWENTDLFELAKLTVRNLTPVAEQAGITLKLTGGSACLSGIPQLLSGIIYNLCDNAIKYNRENGSVTVDVKDTGDAAVLSVSDTGIGIPAEDQNRIFERFYRVDKSHSNAVGGTGLGLSIVKHAQKVHHADLKLESIVDKGTTVSISFPKQIVPTDSQENQ